MEHAELHGKDDAPASRVKEYPWIVVTQRYVGPLMNHDLSDMRDAAAKSWSTDVTERLSNPEI